jgi:hypothetical protein
MRRRQYIEFPVGHSSWSRCSPRVKRHFKATRTAGIALLALFSACIDPTGERTVETARAAIAVSCQPDVEVLAALTHDSLACRYDDQCPCGAYCDTLRETCTADCGPGNPSASCSDGRVCGSDGRCSAGPSASIPQAAARLEVQAPEIRCAAANECPVAILEGSLTAAPRTVGLPALRVQVAGAIEVACESSGTYGEQCQVSDWVTDSTSGRQRARFRIHIRGRSAERNRNWSIHFTSSEPLVGTSTLSGWLSAGAQAPRDGEYVGYIVADDQDAGSPKTSVPAKAWLDGTRVIFQEDSRTIVPTGVLDWRGSLVELPFLVWRQLPAREDRSITRGATYRINLETASPGVLDGRITVRPRLEGPAATDLSLRYRFRMNRERDLQRCEGEASCPDELECGSQGYCVPTQDPASVAGNTGWQWDAAARNFIQRGIETLHSYAQTPIAGVAEPLEQSTVEYTYAPPMLLHTRGVGHSSTIFSLSGPGQLEQKYRDCFLAIREAHRLEPRVGAPCIDLPSWYANLGRDLYAVNTTLRGNERANLMYSLTDVFEVYSFVLLQGLERYTFAELSAGAAEEPVDLTELLYAANDVWQVLAAFQHQIDTAWFHRPIVAALAIAVAQLKVALARADELTQGSHEACMERRASAPLAETVRNAELVTQVVRRWQASQSAGAPRADQKVRTLLPELQALREQLRSTLVQSALCGGKTPALAPLFFGDVGGGPGSRFYAASNHLLTLARRALEKARAAREEARQAWLGRRNESLQNALLESASAQRLLELRNSYGRELGELCGLTNDAGAILPLFQRGEVSPSTCFLTSHQCMSAHEERRALPSCYRGRLGEAFTAWDAARRRRDTAGRLAVMLGQRARVANGYCDRIPDEVAEVIALYEERKSLVGEIVRSRSDDALVRLAEIDEELTEHFATANRPGSRRTECLKRLEEDLVPVRTSLADFLAAHDAETLGSIVARNLASRPQQVLQEAETVIARHQADSAPTSTFHYWASERTEEYAWWLRRARRLTALAARALEYERQQSLALGSSWRPDPGSLARVQELLEAYSINATPWGGVEEFEMVVSLRNDILNLDETSGAGIGTAVERFRRRLLSPANAVYDDSGRYLGQALRFTYLPWDGHPSACAERIWEVHVGFLVSRDAPERRRNVSLAKSNTFASQRCDGTDEALEYARVHPAANLYLGDPAYDIGFVEERSATEAQVQAGSHLELPLFENDRYGASTALAGMGLFGDYTLFIPAAELARPDFDVNELTDIVLRIDFSAIGRSRVPFLRALRQRTSVVWSLDGPAERE